jgi:hypothetical protein
MAFTMRLPNASVVSEVVSDTVMLSDATPATLTQSSLKWVDAACKLYGGRR